MLNINDLYVHIMQMWPILTSFVWRSQQILTLNNGVQKKVQKQLSNHNNIVHFAPVH